MSDRAHARTTSTELARQRSRAAADRTLMAWLRTSLALIGFGFAIGRFFEYLEAAEVQRALDPIHSTRWFGGGCIVLGTLSLLVGVIHHGHSLKRIARRDFVYVAPWPLTMAVALVLVLFGLFAFSTLLL